MTQEVQDSIQSQSNPKYYEDGRNCIVYIKAKPDHQIEIQLSSLDVDAYGEYDSAGYPTKCYDYLKLFNGKSCPPPPFWANLGEGSCKILIDVVYIEKSK